MENKIKVTLSVNDVALLLALLERETALGPINDSKPEKDYIAQVGRLNVTLGQSV